MNALNIFKLNKIQRMCSIFQQHGCKLCTKPENESQPKKATAEITPHRTPVLRRTNVARNELQKTSKWHEEQGNHYTFLRSFYDEDNNLNLIKVLHTPIDLRLKSIKNWLSHQQEVKEIELQQYFPERQQILGVSININFINFIVILTYRFRILANILKLLEHF